MSQMNRTANPSSTTCSIMRFLFSNFFLFASKNKRLLLAASPLTFSDSPATAYCYCYFTLPREILKPSPSFPYIPYSCTSPRPSNSTLVSCRGRAMWAPGYGSVYQCLVLSPSAAHSTLMFCLTLIH